MIIGEHLRTLRVEKKLSQGDLEARTGLLRYYISRVENGHTVPGVETLEKLARALDLKLYQFLYDGDEPPKNHAAVTGSKSGKRLGRTSRRDARFLNQLLQLLPKMKEADRELLLFTVAKMVESKRPGQTG